MGETIVGSRRGRMVIRDNRALAVTFGDVVEIELWFGLICARVGVQMGLSV